MPTKIERVLAQHYRTLFTLALQEVERLARLIMKRYNFTGFVMAMGDAFFVDQQGSQVEDRDPRVASLVNFLDRWDNVLRLTGTPMKIIGRWNAPIITKW